jgi:hypothetical protein
MAWTKRLLRNAVGDVARHAQKRTLSVALRLAAPGSVYGLPSPIAPSSSQARTQSLWALLSRPRKLGALAARPLDRPPILHKNHSYSFVYLPSIPQRLSLSLLFAPLRLRVSALNVLKNL